MYLSYLEFRKVKTFFRVKKKYILFMVYIFYLFRICESSRNDKK